MIRCAFSAARLMMGVTPVENLFLSEYMPAAPEGYVKVYLYGLMLCASPQTERDEMSIALNMDEKELLAAFSYWQAQGLVRIVKAEPLDVEYVPQKQAASHFAVGERRYGALIDSIQKALSGRTLAAPDLKKLYDWVEVFGLEEACVEALVRFMVEEKGHRVSFAYMDKVAQSWADAGILEAEAAAMHIKQQQELKGGAQRILKRWRTGRRPTEDELRLYEKWTRDWGFGEEAILAACAALTGTDKPNFSYLDAVIDNLRLKGAVTEAAVDQMQKEESALRELCRMIFVRAGLKRAPRSSEREEIGRFSEVFGMGAEMLLLAAELSAGASSPYGMMKKLVTGWHERGVSSVSAARTDYEKYGATDREKEKRGVPRALRYPQRRYSEEDLKRLGIDFGDE